MKPSRDDLLIDRYLDRRMPLQEEHAFVARLEADPRLHAMVETERAIRSAMQSQKGSLAAGHAARRSALLETLAATTPAQHTGASFFATLLESTFVRSVIGLVAAGIIVMGLLLIWNGDAMDSHPVPPAPAADAAHATAPATMPHPPGTGAAGTDARTPGSVAGPGEGDAHQAAAARPAATGPGTAGSGAEEVADHPAMPARTASAKPAAKPASTDRTGTSNAAVNVELHAERPHSLRSDGANHGIAPNGAESPTNANARQQPAQAEETKPAHDPIVFPAGSVHTKVKVEPSNP
ncbi:MAG TPA: hypothetical protein VHI13_06980 [Candidatus Kapabacteria bacterium]|nr:hypothetical protein [Candidatus Kapabacteria bacterium]